MKKNGKVAIIGGGLSAVYAFNGCQQAGYDSINIDMFVDQRTNQIGAVFMYQSLIPWKPVEVYSLLLGTCNEYSRKQWGKITQTSAHRRFDNDSKPVTMEMLLDPAEVLPIVWSLIPCVYPLEARLSQTEIENLAEEYDAVICTFPHPQAQQLYQDARYLVKFPVAMQNHVGTSYVVIYNGQDDVPWVRKTIKPHTIFTEYPHTWSLEEAGQFQEDHSNSGSKVFSLTDIKPDVPCIPWENRIQNNILRVGRMAVFDRGYLSHQAVDDTVRFLEEIRVRT